MHSARHVICLWLSGWVGMLAGCSWQDYSEFHGAVSRGNSRPPAPKTHEAWGSILHGEDDLPEGLRGFDLVDGTGILFIYAKPIGGKHPRFTNEGVTAAYFTTIDLSPDTEREVWINFLRATPQDRDQLDGFYRLRGSFDVEQWKTDE